MGTSASRTELSIERVASERRVLLLSHAEFPADLDHRAAVVAGMPFVRLDTESGVRTFRRRRLHLRDAAGGRELTFRARPRALPEATSAGVLPVVLARDAKGRDVPVCSIEPVRHTLHVLLDVESIEVLEHPPGVDPAALLAEIVAGAGIDALLARAGAARFGPEVPARLREWLEHCPDEDDDLVAEEARALEALAGTDEEMPELIRRRVFALQSLPPPRQHGPRPTVNAADIEAARASVERLFHSRVCAWIALDPRGITGLLNPRRLGCASWLMPLGFRLLVGSAWRPPSLRLWRPHLETVKQARTACLGQAIPVLQEARATRNVFAAIDGVLNYLETNRIGLVDANGDEHWPALMPREGVF